MCVTKKESEFVNIPAARWQQHQRQKLQFGPERPNVALGPAALLIIHAALPHIHQQVCAHARKIIQIPVISGPDLISITPARSHTHAHVKMRDHKSVMSFLRCWAALAQRSVAVTGHSMKVKLSN